jgi:ubiquinone/menaquinone biosynthesis C-methylase UbiE
MNAREQWQIATDAAHRYEGVVARYILGPWAPAIVEAGRVTGGVRVLDLACGTGVVARLAAQRAGIQGRVIGVDLNPAMLNVARSLPAPDAASIEWVQGNALAIPLADASVDVVLCQQGLQFFLDRATALREMKRVLSRGGRLALSVWSSAGLYNTAVANALEQFAGKEIASRFHASRDAPGRTELEQLTHGAGFGHVDIRVSRVQVHLPMLNWFALEHLAATPVAASVAALDSKSRQGIGTSVEREMQRFSDRDGVTYPEETRIVTARLGP